MTKRIPDWLKEMNKAQRKAERTGLVPKGVRYDTPDEKEAPIPLSEMRDFLCQMMDTSPIHWFVHEFGNHHLVPDQPPAIELMEPKQCFSNASAQVIHRRGLGLELRYVEGFVISPRVAIPIHHAWVLENDRVVDPTLGWRPQATYLGVEFTPTFLSKQLLKNGYYGLLDTGMGASKLALGIDPDYPCDTKFVPAGMWASYGKV